MQDAKSLVDVMVPKSQRKPHWARTYFWNRGITQKRLAAGANIHPSTLNLILNGEFVCPPRIEAYLQNQRLLLEELDGKTTD